MDQEVLVEEQIDEGAQFLSEFAKKYSVKAAYWLMPTEDSQWYLYIASDQINDSNKRDAYREVLRLSPPLSSLFFDAFRVKLIGTDDATAMAALDIHRRFPGKIPTRYNKKSFGQMPVEGVYIYPAPIPLTSS